MRTIEPRGEDREGLSFDCISPAYEAKPRHFGTAETPERLLTSVSQYVLADFPRDFPDDEACRHWLWRQRVIPGSHGRPL
jgi:hypothetical protein